MAIGDDAANAGMDVLTGTELANTIDTEINKSRDYIAQRTSAITPVAKGGTGAATAAAARANLDVVGNDQIVIADGTSTIADKIPRYDGVGHIACASPSAANHAASKAYVDNRPTGISASGGTFTGNVFFPNATAASSSYTVAYINGDGRLSRGASSRRYKEAITDAPDLGDLWPRLVEYEMIGGDGDRKIGYIAEELADTPTLARFVVYDIHDPDHPVVDSIDFIALLIAQNAQLNARVAALEARL